jgi:hypothetical protein
MPKNMMDWSCRIPKKMYRKLYTKRRRGRPKKRWLDDVSTDLRKMGINEWKERE